jgi:hypothetical protein
MNRTLLIVVIVVLLVLIAGVAPVLAHGRVGVEGSIWIGPGYWGPWWGAPVYPYPYAYPYGYSYAPPPVIERQPTYEGTLQEDQPYYWYFCPGSKTYYPYVKQCPEGWLKVVPPGSPSPGKE